MKYTSRLQDVLHPRIYSASWLIAQTSSVAGGVLLLWMLLLTRVRLCAAGGAEA